MRILQQSSWCSFGNLSRSAKLEMKEVLPRGLGERHPDEQIEWNNLASAVRRATEF
jgi:hypothetical protein